MKKETEKFIFQLLTFAAMVTFALMGFDGWATVMLLTLFYIIK